MAEEMNEELARQIYNDPSEFGDEYDAAVDYLTSIGYVIINDKQLKARQYLVQAASEEQFDEKYEQARAIVEEANQQIPPAIEEEEEIYDREHHLDMEDEEAVLRNTKKVFDMVEQIEFDDEDHWKERITFIDDEQEPAENQEDYWSVVVESARQQAAMLRAGDQSFFMKKDENKRETLKRDIQNFVAVTIVKGVTAGAMKEPTEEEAKAGTPAYVEYLKRESEKAAQTLNNLMESGNQMFIKTSDVMNEAVDTSMQMASYAARWAQKKMKRVAKAFDSARKKFDGKMKNFWGKAYEIRKNAVEHMKNNKWRLISDTMATTAVALTAGTGLALPVVAGYALYTAAGSWAWPLIEKKTKAIRAAQKEGEPTKEWEGIAGIKKAYTEIKADKNEYKKYKNRAYTGTAFGIAGAGVVVGMGAAANWAVDKAGYLAAKIGSSVIRSTGSVTSQWLNYRDVKKEFKQDPSAENRAKLKQAKFGLGLGATIAMAGNLLSFNRLLESNAEQNGGLLDKIKGWFGKEDEAPATPVAPVAPVHEAPETQPEAPVSETPKEPEPEAPVSETPEEPEADIVTAPTEYDADMGISEKHWNEMHKKLTGIYGNQSEIFGKENVSSEDAWNNMYQNLENARAANPEMFGDMTNEQVLYKYMKLIEFTERAKVGPDGYLVTRLAADGLPTYADAESTEVMRALNAVIVCGEEVNVSDAKIGKVLNYINERNGQYSGPGAGVGTTSNVYVGGRVECGENYQNAWRRGVRKVIAHRTPTPDPVVAPKPVEVTPPPAPAEVEEVVVNQEIPNQPSAEIGETVRNEQIAPSTVTINEGATDGNLDVNSDRVRNHSRSFKIPTSEGR